MSEQYTPDNRFVERLEWQLSTEFRRGRRLAPPAKRIAVPRVVVAASLMAGLLLTGVATIKAAEFIRDSWRKKIEIARAETKILLDTAQLESLREMESQAKQRYDNGLIHEEEYRVLKLAAEKAALALLESRLNLEEVQAAGSVPEDGLHAPVLRGRDFVSERLKIKKDVIELEVEFMGRQMKRIRQLVENGLVEGSELDRIQTQIANQEKILEEIRKQLELRRRFVAREISARELEIQDRITEAERNLHLAESKIKILHAEMKRLKELESRGLASHTETARLEYVLSGAQAEWNLAVRELEILNDIK